jgi:hypothetical protein
LLFIAAGFPNAFELHHVAKHVRLGPFCIPKAARNAEAFLAALDEWTAIATFMEQERIGRHHAAQHVLF